MALSSRLRRAPARPRDAAGAFVQPWDITGLTAQYGWPKGAPGRAPIGIIECGGGWLPSDMALFSKTFKIAEPAIIDVPLDINPAFGKDNDSDSEVALDIQIAAAAFLIATGTPAAIRLYWCSDITSGIRKATEEKCGAISISWGGPENTWESIQRAHLDEAAFNAMSAGIALFAAAGDDDGDDGESAPIVDYPAASPYIVGCGGTRLLSNGLEIVWNNNPGSASGTGTGGGYSREYNRPIWQIGAPTGATRMVPDVAGNADPDTGYRIVLNGKEDIVGGTSAVAPLYAGLFAAIGGDYRNLLKKLWSHPADFIDISIGDNGVYRAYAGPDPCTGLGRIKADSVYQRYCPSFKSA